jgi:hypothetical protein
MTSQLDLRSLLRRSGVVAAACGLFLATNSLAADTTIHGCYRKITSDHKSGRNDDGPEGNDGQLRISEKCRPNEIAISWNSQGPKGDPGNDGLPGTPGAPGSPGVSGLERVHFSSSNDSETRKDAFARCPKICKGGTNAGNDCLADSNCPAGTCSGSKHVVGGGAQVFIGEDRVLVGPVAIKKSWPADSIDGWAATAEEIVPTDLRWHLTAYALCANVAE